MKIIDAHSHLWLRQDAEWNGKRIQTMENGRSMFLGEEVQMIPPFLIDGKNSAEVFLSNMNYAQVSAAVVVQEFIDGLQNDYLENVGKKYPYRFMTSGMVDYFKPGSYVSQLLDLAQRGFQMITIPGHRLITDKVRILLNSDEMMQMYREMDKRRMMLNITLADGDMQVGEIKDVIQEFPNLKIAIGHFGMVTREGWMSQIRLARHKNVYVESGGITWLFNDEFYPFPSAIRAIKQAADEVGMDKLMWGSDYPRTITAITYKMSYDFVEKSADLTADEKRMFLGQNAKQFFGFGELPELPYIKNMSE